MGEDLPLLYYDWLADSVKGVSELQ
jgi:hypothetical protein